MDFNSISYDTVKCIIIVRLYMQSHGHKFNLTTVIPIFFIIGVLITHPYWLEINNSKGNQECSSLDIQKVLCLLLKKIYVVRYNLFIYFYFYVMTAVSSGFK